MNEKAEYYVNKLKLIAHPEGGYFKEVYRSDEFIEAGCLQIRYKGKRTFSTSIYFLLEGKQISSFHKLKSDETWHFYDGSSVKIFIINEKGELIEKLLGKNLEKGEEIQFTIEKNNWFAAEVINKDLFSLVGCTVAPGFEFDDFQLAKREDLADAFPEHKKLIERFTKD